MATGGTGVGGYQPNTTNGYQQQQQQQHQYPPQQSYGGGNAGYSNVTSPPPPAAAPTGSYAARSAQAYATQNMHQPSVSVMPTPDTAPGQSYGMASPQPAQQTGGYAARSAQAYANNTNTFGTSAPAPNMTPPANYGGQTPNSTPAAPAGSYAARSQQAFANVGSNPTAGPPAPNMAAQQSPQAQQQFGAAQSYAPQGQQQPPRSFTSPAPTPPHAQASSGPMTAQQATQVPGGGYAARAAQAHATAAGGAAQQQPPSTVLVNSHGPQASPQRQIPPPAVPNAYARAQSDDNSTIATHPTTMGGGMPQQQPGMAKPSTAQPGMANFGGSAPPTPHVQAVQQRLLTDATRKVQEHAYYMRQAMDQNNLPVVLERAAYMAGELGVPPHGSGSASANAPSLSNTGIAVKLTPKNYYELYMRALEDMPSFEDYLLGMASAQQQELPQQQPMYGQPAPPPPPAKQPSYSVRELYDCVQYCPRVLSRLYLQISAGSALIRSGQVGPKWILNDLIQCVKCEQNPIRGLFLRNYLLTVLRDKLPDTPEQDKKTGEEEESATAKTAEDEMMEPGNVKDSYEFVMENFMEMNKLWVRLQHLPGDGNTKEVKKRRERERNDLRILVGTNLVRISQLEGVTSKIYGENILPRVLDHVVVVGDPLSQAYLMDCLVQVFPDEYHIETLPILLNVCPRLRDKVNIRTILQGLMDRLANYLADEELLDESDTNQVKLTLARDSFGMFEECVQKVYNARGPKLTSKEVIRLQTALLQFSLKCYPGNMDQIARCVGACVLALQQANASFEFSDATVATVPKALDDVSVAELEKLLSIPVESFALRVLELDHYVELVGFLPWANRRAVAKSMLEAVDKAGAPPKSTKQIQQLFSVIEPLTRSENATISPAPVQQTPTEHATALMSGLGVSAPTTPVVTLAFGDLSNEGPMTPEVDKECALVSKLVQLLEHENTDVVYEMLSIAREQIRRGSSPRGSRVLVSVVFAALKLVHRIHAGELRAAVEEETKAEPKTDTNATEAEAEAEDTPNAQDETEKADPDEETGKGDDAEDPRANGEANNEESDAIDPKEEKKAEDETQKIPSDQITTAADGAKPPEATPKKITARQVFIFIQETVGLIGVANSEGAVKMTLEVALTADSLANGEGVAQFSPIVYEMLSQSFSMYEDRVSEPKAQQRCVTAMIGALLTCRSLSESDYETLITKTAQFSAKLTNKADQCQMVAECSHLFYPVEGASPYSNPQRALECLQRSLKLADAATSSNTSNMYLFVDLMELYMYFLEKKNPVVTAAYVGGLAALIKEYLRNATDARAVSSAKSHFIAVVKEIQRKKTVKDTAELFAPVEIDTAGL